MNIGKALTSCVVPPFLLSKWAANGSMLLVRDNLSTTLVSTESLNERSFLQRCHDCMITKASHN